MANQYLAISDVVMSDDGSSMTVCWQRSSDLLKAGDEFMATIDYSINRKVTGIELVYFRSELSAVDSFFQGNLEPPSDSRPFVRFRFGDPVAIIKGFTDNEKGFGHLSGAGRILVNGNGSPCGIRIFDLSDEAGHGDTLARLTF